MSNKTEGLTAERRLQILVCDHRFWRFDYRAAVLRNRLRGFFIT